MPQSINRRSVAAAIGVAAVTIPAAGLAGAKTAGWGSPIERIKHHTAELERAMRDCYGVETEVLTFPATDGGMKPCVFVVAHTVGRQA